MTSPTTTSWPSGFMRVGDLTSAGLEQVLALAARMKAEPGRWIDALPGTSLTCLFETPDTRAGLSTEAAAHRLGMEPIRMRPSDLQAGRGEELDDAVRILSRYTRAIVARDLPDRTLTQLARVADVPVVNARSARQHPCQALADLLTLLECFGELRGLVVAYVGPCSNIAVSLMEAGAMTGMEIRLACPPGLGPEPEDRTAAEVLGELHGAKLQVVADPVEAASGAHAVYTAPWPDMDPHRRRELRRYQVTTDLLGRARHDAIFLHPLPAHRGEEVTPGVIDGRRSRVWEQAGNRVPAEQAVIYTFTRAARPGGTET
jgi:ornithine carbamoyltransferase